VIGRNFIQAVIRDGASSRLAIFGDHYFTEEELPLLEFVRNHKARHGTLPDEAVLQSSGYRVPTLRGDQPLSYYEERLTQRFVYNTASEYLPQISTAMQSQQTDAIRQLFREALTSMNRSAGAETVTDYRDEIDNVCAEYELAKASRGRLRGVTLGWPTFDNYTNGAMAGDLVVFAGRPGVGKTTLLSNALVNARRSGKNILALTMEMSKEAFTRRVMGIETGINPMLIRKGELSTWAERQMRSFRDVAYETGGRLYIESGAGTSTVDGISEAVERYAPEVLYVDAAYLMSAQAKSRGFVSKWEQLTDVIRALKALAMRRAIPVFITVQFNRNQKDSGKGAMDLADIGGADAIPQDASVVIGVKRAQDEFAQTRRVAGMIKNREGDGGEITINYRFEPVDLSEIPQDDLARQGNQATDMGWMQ
jgi:replicative DNA helicase